MSRLTYATSLILLTAVALLIQSGCRKESSRWDAAQKASEGKTATESSQARLESDPAAPAGDDDLGQLPAYNPDAAPSESSAPIKWKAGKPQANTSDDQELDLSGDPLPGSTFNKYFPEQFENYDMVAKQEKSGFAQYSLRRDGDEIAQLSISDLRSNPAAAVKFVSADMSVADYPAIKDGSKGTVLLVATRFQVKIRSPQGQLNEQDRITWLKKFDLNGLATLAN